LLDPDRCYRALRSRDARFDGRFFTGVKTTGVYCRPICPARTPKRENVLFYACAAAAEDAGFRPCLRCRPEASPGTPAWSGTSATVARALRHIEAGALDRAGVAELAARLGIGERHLRRLFLDHLGASPVSVAQSRRLLFAKKLINETSLSMTRIAYDSGFGSLRRFNAAVKSSYGVSPSALRRGKRSDSDTHEIALRLPYRPPFDWRQMIGFLAPRAIVGVESVDRETYRRSVRFGDDCGVVTVTAPQADWLLLRVPSALSPYLVHIVARMRRVFDLGADPSVIGAALATDPELRARVRRCPGLRVPGAWQGFETAVRAIVGQQVSVKGATTILGRIVARYGSPMTPDVVDGSHGAPTRTFPSAEALAQADLTGLGMPSVRAAAIGTLAAAVADGRLSLEEPVGLEETIDHLRALPGIGRWTAEYIAMRASGEPDAFPAGDLGLRRALEGTGGRPSERELRARSAAWRPWRAYAAMYLWSVAAAPAA
jgi:AraC family transcriptional regulator of adaptative response / DNA-3-methyladenine glycosylase II